MFPEDDYRVAPTKGLVRVDTSRTAAAVRSLGENVCEYVLQCLNDPKMNIPKAFFNWVVKTGIPRVRVNLDKAVKAYQPYMDTFECDFDDKKYIVNTPSLNTPSPPMAADAKRDKEEGAAAAVPSAGAAGDASSV